MEWWGPGQAARARADCACTGTCRGPGWLYAPPWLLGLTTSMWPWSPPGIGLRAHRYTFGGVSAGECPGAGQWQKTEPDPGPQAAAGSQVTGLLCLGCTVSPWTSIYTSGVWWQASGLWHASTQLEGLLSSACSGGGELQRSSRASSIHAAAEAWAGCQCGDWAPLGKGRDSGCWH